MRGAVETDEGTTGDDGTEAGPTPLIFDAVTVKVYGVPLTKSEIEQVNADASAVAQVPEAWPFGSKAVTEKPIIVVPPFWDGDDQETPTWPSPGMPTTFCGAEGTDDGVTGLEGSESRLLPLAFVAVTVKV